MVFLIEAWGFWFPGQELNPGSLHWKCAVPAMGPPGKSLNLKLQAFSKLVQIQKYSPLSQPAGSLSFFRSFLATTRPFFSLPSSPTLFRYIVFGGIQAWQSVKGKPTVKFKSTCAFIKKKKKYNQVLSRCVLERKISLKILSLHHHHHYYYINNINRILKIETALLFWMYKKGRLQDTHWITANKNNDN